MKLGLGVTVLARGLRSGHLDGIGHYTQEMFDHIAQSTQNIEIKPVAFGDAGVEELGTLTIKRLPRYSVSSVCSALSGLNFLNTKAWQREIDIFHATDHCTPRLSQVPVVATLMDAIPLSHPQWVNKRGRQAKNWLWRQTGQWADHVITISEFSKKEISHHFKIDEQKISVIPLGVDGRYFERLSQEVIDRQSAALGLPERFFLFIGTLQPRKNIDRMIVAHEALPLALRQAFPLIIVGRNGWGSQELVNRLNAYGSHGLVGSSRSPDSDGFGRSRSLDDSGRSSGSSVSISSSGSTNLVRWLQNVDDFSKRVMLQKATALVFPSLIEGFGLPVLEGFASQTPVITSNCSSLPEVAGDAAWLVDPYNVAEMTEAMATLARDESVGQGFVTKGLARARTFTWQTCAQKTIKVYEQVLNKSVASKPATTTLESSKSVLSSTEIDQSTSQDEKAV
jgi:alpha-1,3-rhamnosyl/mannosyltransferase